MKIKTYEEDGRWCIDSSDGDWCIARLDGCLPNDAKIAAHIVRCVNSHDALVEALERYHAIIAANIGELDCDGAFEQARVALAAAKGDA